jgi:hypothetical protein
VPATNSDLTVKWSSHVIPFEECCLVTLDSVPLNKLTEGRDSKDTPQIITGTPTNLRGNEIRVIFSSHSYWSHCSGCKVPE